MVYRQEDPVEMLRRLIEHLEQEWREWMKVKAEAYTRLADLNRQLDNLKEALVKQEARRQAEESSKVVEIPKAGDNFRFSNLSLAEACEVILREAGRPLTAREVMVAALKGGARTGSATPYNVIVTAMRRDKRFIRLRPGLWGLAERDGPAQAGRAEA